MRTRMLSLALVAGLAVSLAAPGTALAAKKPPAQPTVITGTLTSASRPHGAISGATVTAYQYSKKGWKTVAAAVSDVNGVYRFASLSAGTYRIGFTATGYVSEYYDEAADLASATDIVLVTGQTAVVDESLALGPRQLAITGSLSTGTGLTRKIAVSTARDRFYLTHGSGVVVIDGATHQVVADIALPGDTYDVVVDPVHDKAYATHSGGSVEIDLATNAVMRTFATGYADHLAVSPTSGKVFLAGQQTKTITVLDLATEQVTSAYLSDIPDSNMSNTVWDVAVNQTADVVYVGCGYGAHYVRKYACADLTPLGQAYGMWGQTDDMDFDPVLGRGYFPNQQTSATYIEGAGSLYSGISGWHDSCAVDDGTGLVFGQLVVSGTAAVDLVVWDPAVSGAPQQMLAMPFSYGGDVEINEATGEIMVSDSYGNVWFVTFAPAP